MGAIGGQNCTCLGDIHYLYIPHMTHMTHVYNMHICILHIIYIYIYLYMAYASRDPILDPDLSFWCQGSRWKFAHTSGGFVPFGRHRLLRTSWEVPWQKKFPRITLPETNVAPENGGFPIGISFSKGLVFRCYVSFRECKSLICSFVFWVWSCFKHRELTCLISNNHDSVGPCCL